MQHIFFAGHSLQPLYFVFYRCVSATSATVIFILKRAFDLLWGIDPGTCSFSDKRRKLRVSSLSLIQKHAHNPRCRLTKAI
ncbi:hypothetical protein [Silvania hatchlandensis]|uniref:hypothetical protein n=1 Tax=Silvania hatchlandensis TaxID=2926469 RepID=UPI0022FD7B84|nr:hypothetical protein [Silvania hatchlandensis]